MAHGAGHDFLRSVPTADLAHGRDHFAPEPPTGVELVPGHVAGLRRELGLGSYRTAWLMLQKLRQAMVRIQREPLQGTVQVDETYQPVVKVALDSDGIV